MRSHWLRVSTLSLSIQILGGTREEFGREGYVISHLECSHQSPRNNTRSAVCEQFEIEIFSKSGIQFNPHVHIVQDRSWKISAFHASAHLCTTHH